MVVRTKMSTSYHQRHAMNDLDDFDVELGTYQGPYTVEQPPAHGLEEKVSQTDTKPANAHLRAHNVPTRPHSTYVPRAARASGFAQRKQLLGGEKIKRRAGLASVVLVSVLAGVGIVGGVAAFTPAGAWLRGIAEQAVHKVEDHFPWSKTKEHDDVTDKRDGAVIFEAGGHSLVAHGAEAIAPALEWKPALSTPRALIAKLNTKAHVADDPDTTSTMEDRESDLDDEDEEDEEDKEIEEDDEDETATPVEDEDHKQSRSSPYDLPSVGQVNPQATWYTEHCIPELLTSSLYHHKPQYKDMKDKMMCPAVTSCLYEIALARLNSRETSYSGSMNAMICPQIEKKISTEMLKINQKNPKLAAAVEGSLPKITTLLKDKTHAGTGEMVDDTTALLIALSTSLPASATQEKIDTILAIVDMERNVTPKEFAAQIAEGLSPLNFTHGTELPYLLTEKIEMFMKSFNGSSRNDSVGAGTIDMVRKWVLRVMAPGILKEVAEEVNR